VRISTAGIGSHHLRPTFNSGRTAPDAFELNSLAPLTSPPVSGASSPKSEVMQLTISPAIKS
jgi:hypothetical protein